MFSTRKMNICCVVLLLILSTMLVLSCSTKVDRFITFNKPSSLDNDKGTSVPLSGFIPFTTDGNADTMYRDVEGYSAGVEGFLSTGKDSLLTTDVSGNIVSADPLTNSFYCDTSGLSCTQPYATSALMVGSSTSSWNASTDTSGNLTFMKGTPSTATTTSGTPALRMSSTVLSTSGYIGIGTSTPTAVFQINHTTTPGSSPDYAGIYCNNTNSTSSSANSVLCLRTTGSSGGSPYLSMDVNGVAGWCMAVDNSDSQKLKFANSWASWSSPTMTMTSSGYVGIGTTSPFAPLTISIANSGTMGSSFTSKYTDPGTAGGSYTGTTLDNPGWGLYCYGRIYTNSIFCTSTTQTSSDRRIKKDVEAVDTTTALDLVSGLEVKKYKYIDDVSNGEKSTYGFIAQDIEGTLGEAVKTCQEFLPNIFKTVSVIDNVLQGTFTNVEINVGTLLRIVDSEDTHHHKKVASILDNGFIKLTSDEPLPDGKYFVYGTQVDDFKTVSYDTIFSITVGAVQELKKRLDEQEAQIQNILSRLGM